MVAGAQVSGSNAIRAYITTLRAEQKISQDKLAGAIGLAPRTYKAWEKGTIKDMKVPLIIRAIRFLGGDFEHLGELDQVDTARAEQMARDWLALTKEQRAQAIRIQAKFQRVVELGEHDPVRLRQVVEQLRADAESDPAVLDAITAYLDGRRSGRNS